MIINNYFHRRDRIDQTRVYNVLHIWCFEGKKRFANECRYASAVVRFSWLENVIYPKIIAVHCKTAKPSTEYRKAIRKNDTRFTQGYAHCQSDQIVIRSLIPQFQVNCLIKFDIKDLKGFQW